MNLICHTSVAEACSFLPSAGKGSFAGPVFRKETVGFTEETPIWSPQWQTQTITCHILHVGIYTLWIIIEANTKARLYLHTQDTFKLDD